MKWIFRIFLIFTLSFLIHGDDGDGSVPLNECWRSSANESCEIVANITLNSGYVFSIQFECFDESSGQHVQNNEILNKRFANTQKVDLDGCKVPSGFNLQNFGLHFIPNVTEILDVLKIKQFDFDVLKADFIQNFTVLRELSLENNEIDSLFVNENLNLKQVKVLKLRNNKIGYISFSAFEKLEELLWENEDTSYLKVPTVFKKIPLKSVMFKNIKVPEELFKNFPTTLEKLLVTQMKLTNGNSTLVLENNGVLKVIVLVDNDLPSLNLKDHKDIPTVEFLNLSGNCLHEVFLRNFTQLKELDLSRNRITVLDKESFQEMRNLRMLLLKHNNLQTFHLNIFNRSFPSLEFVDVSHNKLMKIAFNKDLQLSPQLQIRVDGNILSCEWLQTFFLNYPEKFGIFKYEKFTSKVNINGLECFANCLNLTETEEDAKNTKLNVTKVNDSQQLSVESLGKKNQRAEALIIIIMLPLGVAFLSILLFLWIKCQKIFHSSFYRTLPYIGSPDRFDVVRQMPSAPEEDYETPLACGNICHDGPDFKCSQNCTLNYEDFPMKEDIYQEIPGDKIVNNIHYDHLSRE